MYVPKPMDPAGVSLQLNLEPLIEKLARYGSVQNISHFCFEE